MTNIRVKTYHDPITQEMADDLESLIPGYFQEMKYQVRPGEPLSWNPRPSAVWAEAHSINELGAWPGAGGTYCYPSDRYPFTVVRVISPQCIVVQDDDAQRVDSNGYGGEQVWKCYPNPLGRLRVLRYSTPKKRWQQEGVQGMPFFYIGKRSRYYAPEI